MPAIVVLDLVLFLIVVVAVLGQIGYRRTARACRRAAAAARLVPAPRQSMDDVERVESSIAAGVVTGQLTGEAYRQRMAELAAADEVRRPLSVPRG